MKWLTMIVVAGKQFLEVVGEAAERASATRLRAKCQPIFSRLLSFRDRLPARSTSANMPGDWHAPCKWAGRTITIHAASSAAQMLALWEENCKLVAVVTDT